jgi:hypothetical protein
MINFSGNGRLFSFEVMVSNTATLGLMPATHNITLALANATEFRDALGNVISPIGENQDPPHNKYSQPVTILLPCGFVGGMVGSFSDIGRINVTAS